MLSCEFSKIFKNTFFTDYLQTTSFEIRRAPVFPDLRMAASVFIPDKLDGCTNAPVRYVNDNDKVHQKVYEFQVFYLFDII